MKLMFILLAIVIAVCGCGAPVSECTVCDGGVAVDAGPESFVDWFARMNVPCADWCAECGEHYASYEYEDCLRVMWWWDISPKDCNWMHYEVYENNTPETWALWCKLEDIALRIWE